MSAALQALRRLQKRRKLLPSSPVTDWRAELAAWPKDLQEKWEERAAILEVDAGFSRKEAERRAFLMVGRNVHNGNVPDRGNR